jgi:hypothetical protein
MNARPAPATRSIGATVISAGRQSLLRRCVMLIQASTVIGTTAMKSPSYGRLFASTARPAPAAIEEDIVVVRDSLRTPPKNRAPPVAATLPPQKDQAQYPPAACRPTSQNAPATAPHSAQRRSVHDCSIQFSAATSSAQLIQTPTIGIPVSR